MGQKPTIAETIRDSVTPGATTYKIPKKTGQERLQEATRSSEEPQSRLAVLPRPTGATTPRPPSKTRTLTASLTTKGLKLPPAKRGNETPATPQRQGSLPPESPRRRVEEPEEGPSRNSNQVTPGPSRDKNKASPNVGVTAGPESLYDDEHSDEENQPLQRFREQAERRRAEERTQEKNKAGNATRAQKNAAKETRSGTETQGKRPTRAAQSKRVVTMLEEVLSRYMEATEESEEEENEDFAENEEEADEDSLNYDPPYTVYPG